METASAFFHDDVHILGTDAEGIGRWIEVFFADYNIDFVTAVALPKGKKIEEQAVELFNKLEIGKNKNGRGILFLIVPETRSVKLEVGYALEPFFTDAFCGYLTRNFVQAFEKPAFLVTKLNGIALSLDSRFNLQKDKYGEDVFLSWERKEFKGPYWGSGGAGAAQKQIADDPAELLTDQEREQFKAGKTPEECLDGFKKALEAIVKDPYLDIYNNMMKIMRIHEGWDFFSNAKYLAILEYGSPLTIKTEGRFAVARPSPTYKYAWPIFLVQGKDGLWRIDEVRLIENSIIDKDGNLRVESRSGSDYDYIQDPYIFDHEGANIDLHREQSRAAQMEDRDLFSEIETIRNKINSEPADWNNYWEAANLFLVCNSITPAYEMIEKALQLKTDDPELCRKAALIYMDYNFMYPRALKLMKKTYDLGSVDKELLENLAFLSGYFKDGHSSERYIKELVNKYPSIKGSNRYKILLGIARYYQGKKKEGREMLESTKSTTAVETYDYFRRVLE